MNAKPILFSADMVQAILEGKKTQTRRVMKLQSESKGILEATAAGELWYIFPGADEKDHYVKCPYGKPGDRLWVREMWRIVGWDEDGDWCIEFSDNSQRWFYSVQDVDEDASVRYWEQCTDDCVKANIPEDDAGYFSFTKEHPCPTRWRPSIHMPQWASRINLEIVNIRVERVQDISREGARAEGVSNMWEWSKEWNSIHPEHFTRGVLNPYVANYSVLWDELNASRGFGWNANPFVWVVEFKKVQP